ncbi:unnamed protein product [Oppiella nova]|uniref:Shugoshin C-terminal domain-containing protein n=1 Tax=Oppiella nova TaxID=334625 RepID=A0A7R9LFK4_9ACAR|nr:unnamed protein product [Oppiella nova]CAG2163051.1 unnamed protein product [Oppiella nova]
MKMRFKSKMRPKKSTTMKERRKQMKTVLRQMVVKSLSSMSGTGGDDNNDNNRQLVDRNASLLAEVEALKREKVQIFESLMFRHNTQHNPNIIKNDLKLLLESLKSDHKNMIELFHNCYEFYNQMITKMSDQIDEYVQREDQLIEHNSDSNPTETTDNRSEEQVSKSKTMFETKRLSRQNGQQLVPNNGSDRHLSVIEEISQDVVNENHSNTTEYLSIDNQMESPKRGNSYTSSLGYALTPHLENVTSRTPSIFNFNCNSFNAFNGFRNTGYESFMSVSDTPLRTELSLTGFDSFESTLTDDQKGITSSTPVHSKRMSGVDMIQRPSKRISSINRPFSPRIGRPSLMDIQNVMDNKTRVVSTHCTSKTLTFDSQCNDTISVNITKNKRKARASSRSIESDLSDSSSLSTRSSRRNRKAVSYKEPSLARYVLTTISMI